MCTYVYLCAGCASQPHRSLHAHIRACVRACLPQIYDLQRVITLLKEMVYQLGKEKLPADSHLLELVHNGHEDKVRPAAT